MKLTHFKNKSKTSQKGKFFNKIILAALLCTGLSAAYGNNCNTTLNNHINWVKQAAPDETRHLSMKMVSHEASFFDSVAQGGEVGEVAYLNTSAEASYPENSFYSIKAQGNAYFDNRTWTQTVPPAFNPCGDCYPFSPYKTDSWFVYFYPILNQMTVFRKKDVQRMSLECNGNQIEGLYTKYISFGNIKIPVSRTKYVVNFDRFANQIPD